MAYAAVNINTADASGCIPLDHACEAVHSKCVKLSLRYGAKGDAASHDGSTALLAACSNGHAECARLCLDAGAQDCANQSGRTPTTSARDRCAIPDGNGPHLQELLLARRVQSRARARLVRELHAVPRTALDWSGRGRADRLPVFFIVEQRNLHKGR